jgi:hypothetical protein
VEGGVQLGPLGTAATDRSIVPTLGIYDDGEIGGMMIGKGNRSTRRKPAPLPLCPPQTPHAARTWTQAAAVGSQRLTTWAMARPWTWPNHNSICQSGNAAPLDSQQEWIERLNESSCHGRCLYRSHHDSSCLIRQLAYRKSYLLTTLMSQHHTFQWSV